MLPPMRRGMGQTVTTGGGGGVAALAGGALSSASAVTSAVLLAVGAVAPPIAALIAVLGATLGPLIAKFSGCGQTCIVATSDVNAVGTQMTAAFQQYMQAPVHYASAQQAFLILFNTLMQQLQQACSNPALGQAGQNCIADNSPNACQWKASPGGWSQGANGQWTYTYWGAAGSGNSCWNPYTGIYDMVANDPTVVPDGTAVSGGTPTVGTNSTTFATPVVATGSTTSAGISLPNLTSLLPSSAEGWLVLGAVALGLVLLL